LIRQRVPRIKIRSFVLFLLSSLAVVHGRAEQGATVQMAPVTVKAGPLGFIVVRLSASTGLLGMVSEDAQIKDLVIIEVLKGSAADRAGLAAQDQILRACNVSHHQQPQANRRQGKGRHH
jgi:predicted metalloprotease with PDZ domain